jgi:hypothetical protein
MTAGLPRGHSLSSVTITKWLDPHTSITGNVWNKRLRPILLLHWYLSPQGPAPRRVGLAGGRPAEETAEPARRGITLLWWWPIRHVIAISPYCLNADNRKKVPNKARFSDVHNRSACTRTAKGSIRQRPRPIGLLSVTQPTPPRGVVGGGSGGGEAAGSGGIGFWRRKSRQTRSDHITVLRALGGIGHEAKITDQPQDKAPPERN